jgi:hypothetical protein
VSAVDLDRLKAAFDQAVEYALPQVDYHALYATQVVAQNADGTLDLQPSRSDWPTQKKIPFRCGIPGVSITVNVGAQVLLGWVNGDPSNPYAALWPTGAPGDLQAWVVNAAQKISLVAPQVNVGGDPGTNAMLLGNVYRAAEDELFGQLATQLPAAGAAITAAVGAPSWTLAAPLLAPAGVALSALASAFAAFSAAAATYLSAIGKVS